MLALISFFNPLFFLIFCRNVTGSFLEIDTPQYCSGGLDPRRRGVLTLNSTLNTEVLNVPDVTL